MTDNEVDIKKFLEKLPKRYRYLQNGMKVLEMKIFRVKEN